MAGIGGFGMYIGGSGGGGGGGLPPDGVYGQITVSGSGTVWMINQTADVNIGTYQFVGSAMKADSSAGGYLLSNSGAQAMQWGAGGGQNVTFYDGVKLDAKTASRIVTTDASKNLATDLSLTTDGTLSANSDTNVPSEKAVKTYADTKEPLLGYTPEDVANKSTNTSLGTSNILYPTQNAVKTYADTKEPLLGYTPENVANKSTDTALGTSNTLYPTQNAVKIYVDNNVGLSSQQVLTRTLGS